MSSAVVSTSAALGRPFVFDGEAVPEVSLPMESAEHPPSSPAQTRPPQRVRRSGELAASDPRLTHITPASRLDIRPAPEMVSSGIPALDTLTGGLPRGCLTEICGPASSGRTTLLLAALAAATRRREFCAVVDASDSLDPHSAAAAGVELDHLLWVRCGFDHTSSRQYWHRLEQVLRATDLLLESGGFGLIVLDLGDMPTQAARRIPLTTWFRFRRTIEHTPTILLTIEQHPIAGSCSSLLLQLGAANENGVAAERRKSAAHGASRGRAAETEQAPEGRKKISLIEQPTLDFQVPAPTQLLTGLEITAELIRSRLERKPARSIAFTTKTAWAG